MLRDEIAKHELRKRQKQANLGELLKPGLIFQARTREIIDSGSIKILNSQLI
jgi:hypothetical protein